MIHGSSNIKFNLQELRVLYIERAYRYHPNVALYIYFYNNYKYWVLLNMLPTLRFSFLYLFLVHVLFTFYIQSVLKFKCKF
jgi:hypothetical protein